MLSFWEKESFIQYHHIIIGSGLVGLYTAIELKKKFPKQSVLILERGILPTGASTKNAGFACMGSVTELLDDLQTQTEQELLELFEMRKNGLDFTRKLLGDAAIGYQENGSYELLSSTEINALDQLARLNKILFPILKTNAFSINDSIIEKSNFNKNTFVGAIQNHAEGELHSGKLLKSLIAYAHQVGIEIFTGCHVINYQEQSNKVDIICKSMQQEIIFTANKLWICTNAFTKQLLPNINLEPGRGQVIITKPINNLSFKGIYHLHQGYYYFRVVDHRVLLGGGRNIDKATEATTSFDENIAIIQALKTMLKVDILPNTNFEIDYNWTGIMAFGSSKNPIIEKYSNAIYLAVRCGGMGVAIASQMAQQCVGLFDAEV
jgi:gamma-glutamylputrescine oxidase